MTEIDRIATILEDAFARRGRNATAVGIAAAIWSAGYTVVEVSDLETLKSAIETSAGCMVCGKAWDRASRTQAHKPGWPCTELLARLRGEEER